MRPYIIDFLKGTSRASQWSAVSSLLGQAEAEAEAEADFFLSRWPSASRTTSCKSGREKQRGPVRHDFVSVSLSAGPPPPTTRLLNEGHLERLQHGWDLRYKYMLQTEGREGERKRELKRMCDTKDMRSCSPKNEKKKRNLALSAAQVAVSGDFWGRPQTPVKIVGLRFHQLRYFSGQTTQQFGKQKKTKWSRLNPRLKLD